MSSVDTWGTAPADLGDGWQPDNQDTMSNGWKPDGNSTEPEWKGEISTENVSKHDIDRADTPHDGGCRICHEEGHFARDCSMKKENDGLCFNCQQPGHSKAECTNERVERPFDGECRTCGQSGHRAASCPLKKCKVCGEEGHGMAECSANRTMQSFAGLNLGHEGDVETAWDALKKADAEKDLNEIKKALLNYALVCPDATLPDLETAFRREKMNTYLIAKKQEVSNTHTIGNLQGQIDQTYVVSFQFFSKPRRAKFAEGWPETPEENMSRLGEAGFVLDRMVPKCSNCNELGHISKNCPEEKAERVVLQVTCAVCGADGHRARDCVERRRTKGKTFTCKNCGEEGHKAAECEKCRNCLEVGHDSKECRKPKDWSRVQCRNCQEYGHGEKRCPIAPKDDDREYNTDPPVSTGGDDGAGGSNWEGNGNDGAGGSFGGSAWQDSGETAQATGDGW